MIPLHQQKQLLRTFNAARSVQSIGQQASVYIRLATPPPRLPGYVHLQTGSDWMTTALLCAGMESSTLPTRLNATAHKRASLGLLEDTLNTTGNQNLFELKASAGDATSRQHHAIAETASDDPRTRGRDGNGETLQLEPSQFDLDYSTDVGDTCTGGSSQIFSQVECVRGMGHGHVLLPSLTPEERLRRRLNEECVVEK